MSITTVNLGKIRLNWKGPWATTTAYVVNDAVSYGGSSYVCIVGHTSGTFATDLASADWQLMAQGASQNTTAGDITYYGASGNARLPIGTAGQVLTVNSSGYPSWGNPNAEGNVYYVSDDSGLDTNNGTSLNAAFKTLRKACDTVTGPATIYVKAGTYNEKLPITVPANVTIVGDGMRNTVITPLLGSASTTYTPSGSSGTTLKVASTSGIAVGMTITGTGFASAQKVTIVVDSTTLTISAIPDTTPSGTLTFRHLSTDASPVTNNLSTMFYLSDQTMLQGLLLQGMTGFTAGSTANDITTATIGGVYLRLNPASPIANKSPYIKDCTAQSSGGVGAIVDGSVHGSGYKSMVFWAYNIVMDNGVGIYAKNGGRIEAVSVFTYFAYFSYVASGGGQIRSIAGNSSYGTYGAVSLGYDTTETAVTATVYGGMLTYNNALATGTFAQGETITQATSGAQGVVTSVQTGYLYYKLTSGTFNTTNLVTGGSSGATMTPTVVGGQANYVLVLSSLSAVPQVGASIQFATGDTSAYVISATSTAVVNSVTVYIITLAQQKVTPSTDGTIANIRYNFSLVRLQSHDFLYIGTGGISATNYPNIVAANAVPSNQIVYTFPGRVYYVSTDEKGNFNVGQYFSVNQATGSATLNASAFNLSGLTSLRLGSIGAQLGAQINEFSTDGTLSQNSNLKVPTQNAVTTYLGAAYQSISPATTATYDLGSSSYKWKDIYASGNLNIATGITTSNTGTVSLLNTTATTINFGGAATTLSIGASTGTATINNANVVITGNLTVNGTTTTVNSTTVTVDDINIELGSVASPTDTTANGGGITLKGASDKTIIWDSANNNWTSSENWNIATGKTFKINNVTVLDSSNVLASAVTPTLGGNSTTGVTLGGSGLTTVQIGNNTSAANTVTVGGGITGNTVKIASTAGGTINLSTDVTTGTVNEWASVTSGTVNFANGITTGTLNIAGGSGASNVNISNANGTTTIKGTLSFAGSTSGTVKFIAPATAGTQSYTLPTAVPVSDGLALVSTTGGVLSWSAAGATLADDTSTTTLYPVLSTSATGSLTSAKTTASKLTFNASSGNLSATQLTGTIQTASQPNITTLGGVTSIGASGSATITGTLQTAAQTNITSVGTLSSLTVSGTSGVTSFTGTTSLGLTVRGSTSSNDYSGIDFRSTNGNSGSNAIARIAVIAAGSGSSMLFGTSNSYGSGITNTGMTLDYSGNVTVAGTITSNSDARLKTNVETITGALDKVLALRGVMYDRISTGAHEMGTIAQEVEQVVPELVFTDADGIKSVAYANTVALLIEAIKEQQKQIDELKGKI